MSTRDTNGNRYQIFHVPIHGAGQTGGKTERPVHANKETNIEKRTQTRPSRNVITALPSLASSCPNAGHACLVCHDLSSSIQYQGRKAAVLLISLPAGREGNTYVPPCPGPRPTPTIMSHVSCPKAGRPSFELVMHHAHPFTRVPIQSNPIQSNATPSLLSLYLPQHLRLSSSTMAHVCQPPAVMDLGVTSPRDVTVMSSPISSD